MKQNQSSEEQAFTKKYMHSRTFPFIFHVPETTVMSLKVVKSLARSHIWLAIHLDLMNDLVSPSPLASAIMILEFEIKGVLRAT